MPESIITSLDDGLYTILLNNPAKHNCMGLEMLNQLREAVQEAAKEENARVVLIRGAGHKSFSTGANLKEFNALRGKEIDHWILLGHEIFYALESLPIPTLAYVQGYAMGGGLELALSCDFRVATADALFSFPEVSHGWLPGWGGITRIHRLLGEAQAKKMILLSESVNGERAFEMGLVTKLLDDADQLEANLQGFIDQLMAIDPGTYKLAKAALKMSAGNSQKDQYFDVLATHAAKQK
ncbi:MAG: enoyl-CoA hydratase/isomerase family protein [Bacteroidota bacterium]